jgi:predicted alpha/beta-hydrolase family hydrolase
VYFSAHDFDQALRDGQAQAGAAEAPRGRGVRLRESLEDPIQLVRRDADAGVVDGEAYYGGRRAALLALDIQIDVTVRRELDGIPEQVHDDLSNPPWVADDP